MNIILIIAFLFFVGCILGWGLEVLFRRFISKNNPEKKWINPGFLNGPYLPLYGSGLAVLYLLASIDLDFINNEIIHKAIIFLIMAAAMTLIEYITGIIFIKRMKVKLWDYKDEWGNIQGIICPKFSFAWALLGAIYYFLVHPYILDALNWLSANLAFSFFIGFFYGIFVIDIFYSCNILGKVHEFANEYNIIVRYDELRTQIVEEARRGQEKARLLFIFGTVQPLMEQLKLYKKRLDDFETVINGTKEKLENLQKKVRNPIKEMEGWEEDKSKDKEDRSKDKESESRYKNRKNHKIPGGGESS